MNVFGSIFMLKYLHNNVGYWEPPDLYLADIILYGTLVIKNSINLRTLIILYNT